MRYVSVMKRWGCWIASGRSWGPAAGKENELEGRERNKQLQRGESREASQFRKLLC